MAVTRRQLTFVYLLIVCAAACLVATNYFTIGGGNDSNSRSRLSSSSSSIFEFLSALGHNFTSFIADSSSNNDEELAMSTAKTLRIGFFIAAVEANRPSSALRRAFEFVKSLDSFLAGTKIEATYFIFTRGGTSSTTALPLMANVSLDDEFAPTIAKRVELFFLLDEGTQLATELSGQLIDAPRRCLIYLASPILQIDSRRRTMNYQRTNETADEPQFDFFVSIDERTKLVPLPSNLILGGATSRAMKIRALFHNHRLLAYDLPNFQDIKQFTFEGNPKSCAYNNPHQQERQISNGFIKRLSGAASKTTTAFVMYGGHVFGGKPAAFNEMCEYISSCWRSDLANGISSIGAAFYETYLNNFLRRSIIDVKSNVNNTTNSNSSIGNNETNIIQMATVEDGLVFQAEISGKEMFKLAELLAQVGHPRSTSPSQPSVSLLSYDKIFSTRARWNISGDEQAISGGASYMWRNADNGQAATAAFDNSFSRHHITEDLLAMAAIDRNYFYLEASFDNDTDRQAALVIATQHDKDAETLKQAITAKYLKRMHILFRIGDLVTPNYMAPKCQLQFLSYACTVHGDVGLCGGYGDRTHGLVAAASIAIGSRRIFHIDWTKNSQLGDYFNINEAFYNVSQTVYQQYLRRAEDDQGSNHKRNFIDSGAENAFVDWGAAPDFRSKFDIFNSIAISSNSMSGIEGALKNPTFRPVFEELIADHFPRNKTVDTSIFISAILRIIFGDPNSRLRQLVQQCVIDRVGNTTWSESYRIGIQIRQLRGAWGESTGHRVTEKHFPCFIDEIDKIVTSNVTRAAMLAKGKKQFIVFVTSDNEAAIDYVRKALSPSVNKTLTNITTLVANITHVITSSDNCADLKLVHSDRTEAQSSATAWIEMAKPFIDWLVLTMMDQLVISRSGFAESASLFSLRPTRRLVTFTNPQNLSCPFHYYNILGRRIRFDLGLR